MRIWNVLFCLGRALMFSRPTNVIFIAAIQTFTCVRARNSRIKALAIFFLAIGFLTIATFFRKTAGLSPFLLDIFLCLLNFLMITLHVFALATYTVLVAGFVISKTFTVHLETECFFTSAPNPFFLSRSCRWLNSLNSQGQWVLLNLLLLVLVLVP